MAHETDGTPRLPDAFLVRVLRPDGQVAGIGTFIGDRRIVTCAHVVNAALGLDPLAQARPLGTVRVDFPLAAHGAAPLTAAIASWVPPPKPGAAGDDVAGLLLADDPPAPAGAAKLGVEPARTGQALRVFGYPGVPPRPDGVFVQVTVRGRVGGGKLQLDSAPDSAHRVQPGFSGSPVFDDALGRVVGMISTAPPSGAAERDSYAIDAERLRLAWPEVLGARWQRGAGAGAGRGRARDKLTILHVSDTQFGKNHLFGGNGLTEADREEDSLFARLHQDLGHLAAEDRLRPDLIVVTGDLAEWGLRSEFARVSGFLAALAEAAEVPRRHVAIVPGNHDVNRRACLAYFADAEANEEQPIAPYFPKWRDYAAAFEEFYVGVPGVTFTPDEPWTLFEMPDLNIVVAGLNSTMAESHLDTDHYGWVGEHQLRWFARRLESYRDRGWLRLAAVHHNVVRGAVLDDENLRDADDLDQILGPGQQVNLLLHGHTHDAKLHFLSSGMPVLATGSAAVTAEARPAEVPNQYQLVTVSQASFTRHARQYALGQRRWIGDTRVSASGSDWRDWRGYVLDDVSAALAPPVGADARDAPAGVRRSRTTKIATGGRDTYTNAPPHGGEASEEFLSRVAEATRVRFQDKASVSERSRDGCDYLRVSRPVDSGAAEVWPVGVIDGPATEAGLAAFVEHVHAQFAATTRRCPPSWYTPGPPPRRRWSPRPVGTASGCAASSTTRACSISARSPNGSVNGWPPTPSTLSSSTSSNGSGWPTAARSGPG
jgi:3',5'-cyclic AMP phosphodiesterase CpdA